MVTFYITILLFSSFYNCSKRYDASISACNIAFYFIFSKKYSLMNCLSRYISPRLWWDIISILLTYLRPSANSNWWLNTMQVPTNDKVDSTYRKDTLVPFCSSSCDNIKLLYRILLIAQILSYSYNKQDILYCLTNWIIKCINVRA